MKYGSVCSGIGAPETAWSQIRPKPKKAFFSIIFANGIKWIIFKIKQNSPFWSFPKSRHVIIGCRIRISTAL